MIILKNIGENSIQMRDRVFLILIGFLSISSFGIFDEVLAEREMFLTPWEETILFKNHFLIVEISDTQPETIPPEITFQACDAAGANCDTETIPLTFDPETNLYRVGINSHLGTPSVNNQIEAFDDQPITINYRDLTSVVWFEDDHEADGPANQRTTYDQVIPCPASSNENNDGDGICDAWETGTALVIDDPTGNFVYTYPCNVTCDENTKDIFLELDWIDSHQPDQKALDQLVTTFANNGINLHIQVDSESAYGHLLDIEFPGEDPGGAGTGFDQIKSEEFGTPQDLQNITGPWAEARKLKHQVFHYGLIAHRLAGESSQTGIGEIFGNDFLITLGTYTGKTGSTAQQAGTIMHELGHNLGLNHGGDMFNEVNNKPNYFSVMTYARQFPDLNYNSKLDYSHDVIGHHHSSLPEPYNLHTETYDLDEAQIQGQYKGLWESEFHDDQDIIFSCPDGQAADPGYKLGAQGGVAWNCIEPPMFGFYTANVNNLPSDPYDPNDPNTPDPHTRLKGHNDWAALQLDFSSHPENFADGRHDLVAAGKELTFEKMTLNRISALLTLYRQIEWFEENDFSGGFGKSLPTNSIDLPVDGTSKTVPVNTEVSWSNNDVAPHTVTSGSVSDGPSGVFDSGMLSSGTTFSHTFDVPGIYEYFCMLHPWESDIIYVGGIGPGSSHGDYKESFKTAVKNAIKKINLHDIIGAKKLVLEINSELNDKLIGSANYNKVKPITANLDGTYVKALGVGTISIDEPLPQPIIPLEKINEMIQDVENFVAGSKIKGPQCGLTYHMTSHGCQCNSGFTQDQNGNCVHDTLVFPPLLQVKLGISPDKVECNADKELVQSPGGNPNCVFSTSKQKLLGLGWSTFSPSK